jgi:hypothetical protein
MAKYKVYHDPRKARLGNAVAINGPKGTRRVQNDGRSWKCDARKLDPYEKQNAFIVNASSYKEALEKARKRK